MTLPVAPYTPPSITNTADPVIQTNIADVKAANTSPTPADSSLVTSLSSNNTGLPVNVPTIVQSTSNKSTGSVASLAKAFASSNIAGNSIVVVCGIGNGTDPTIADTNSNTYTKAVTGANSTTFEVSIWYAVNVVGGANTVTVTNAGATASMAMEIYEVNGLLTQVTAQPGGTITNTGTGTTASTAAITAGIPNEISFAGVAVGTAAQTITPAAGWTNDSGQQNPTTPAGLFSFASMSQFLGSTKAVTPSAAVASSEPWAIAVANFKPVAVGVQGTVSIHGYNYTHITSAATTLVKTGPGVLHSIVANKLVGSATIEFDDALTNTTPVIGIVTIPGTVTSATPFTLTYNVAFTTGLSITTVGSSPDYTVVWK